jgi:hypothetical protein
MKGADSNIFWTDISRTERKQLEAIFYLKKQNDKFHINSDCNADNHTVNSSYVTVVSEPCSYYKKMHIKEKSEKQECETLLDTACFILNSGQLIAVNF